MESDNLTEPVVKINEILTSINTSIQKLDNTSTLETLHNDLSVLNDYIYLITSSDPWYKDPQWFAIIVALTLGVLGIFQDWIRGIFKKPKLNPTLTLEPPDCHKISLRSSTTGDYIQDTYYYRFKVQNQGNYFLEDTEVLVTELYEKDKNNDFKKLKSFLPINLVWAHNHLVTMPKIQSKMFKHCDFFHILKTSSATNMQYLKFFGKKTTSKVFLELDPPVKPNTGSHILLPNEYKIKIVFGANNVNPKEKIYHIDFKDIWYEDEQTMLKEGVKITEVRKI